MIFFSPCPRGLEGVLADELRHLGAQVLAEPSGGVRFEGDAGLGYRVNLHSRIASRVLQQVAQSEYRQEDDLYRLARDTGWETWHEPTASLRIDIESTGTHLQSLQFALLRIKDGIVDRARERGGERPSIERVRPARRVFAFLSATQATLYLDWSGEALFKRGWRLSGTDAPLKENLAAGLLALSGWQPGEAFLDPFCGSGTLLIEAAQKAAGIAAGFSRPFAFERMRGFDRQAWNRMRSAVSPASAQSRAGSASGPVLMGSDISEAAIAAARANLARSGVDPGSVTFRQLDVLHLEAAPAPSGTLVTNPPYGERLDMKGRQRLAEADRFWPALATVLKERFTGWNVHLLTSDLQLPRRLRLSESRRTPLFNGALECRLFRFEMFAGAAPRRKERASQEHAPKERAS